MQYGFPVQLQHFYQKGGIMASPKKSLSIFIRLPVWGVDMVPKFHQKFVSKVYHMVMNFLLILNLLILLCNSFRGGSILEYFVGKIPLESIIPNWIQEEWELQGWQWTHTHSLMKIFLCSISVLQPVCKKSCFEILGSVTLNTLVVGSHWTHAFSIENIA